jgi:hypothetical protein
MVFYICVPCAHPCLSLSEPNTQKRGAARPLLFFLSIRLPARLNDIIVRKNLRKFAVGKFGQPIKCSLEVEHINRVDRSTLMLIVVKES